MAAFIHAINQALDLGYDADQVLTHLSTKYKSIGNQIYSARRAGYRAEQILSFLSTTGKFKSKAPQENEFTKTSRALGYTRPGERLREGVKTAAKAAPFIVGGALAARSLMGRGVVKPQVLPALGGNQLPGPGAAAPTTINITPKPPGGGGAGLARGLPAPGPATGGLQKALPAPKAPIPPAQQAAPSPAPMLGGPRQMPAVRPSMQRNVQMVKGIGEETRLQNLIIGGLGIKEIAGVLQKILPKEKFNVLTKAEGGLPQLIEDYQQHLQMNPQEMPETLASKIEKGLPTEIPKTQATIQREQPFTEEEAPIAPQQAMAEQPAPEARQPSIRERVQQAAFSSPEMPKALKDYSVKGREFAIPTYRQPNEDPQEYNNRQIVQGAIKKAANALLEGKSFLDFPEALKGAKGLSVAEDVLRFMAGVSNVYDPLLDDQEKDELFDSLQETHETPEGLRPTPGERNIYGAQMTPNLVWNMLLAVEPRLREIEKPPKIKGAAKEGERMSGSDFRRMLTHSVYGVLSGRNLSPELGDKIAKISNAVAVVDDIAKAAKAGNQEALQRKIDLIQSDDEALFAAMVEWEEEHEELQTLHGKSKERRLTEKQMSRVKELVPRHPEYQKLIR
jgi:hypothetical protein